MIEDKIRDRNEACLVTGRWRKNGEIIVFTNGCFDILHPGHIRYLEKARTLGDRLIIGLNSDASVIRLKGPKRPVNSEKDRAVILAALEMTDLVVLFDEDTPAELITELNPHILVKGGDYHPHEVAGRDHVEKNDGRVVIVPFEDGYSTSRIIDKIKQNEGQ